MMSEASEPDLEALDAELRRRGAEDRMFRGLEPHPSTMLIEFDRATPDTRETREQRVTDKIISNSPDAAQPDDDAYDGILIPNGAELLVTYIGFDEFSLHKRQVWALRFRVNDGPHAGRMIARFYNAIAHGHIPRSHNLRRDWVNLTQLRPPKFQGKPRAFLERFVAGVELRVRTRVVNRRMEEGDWKETPVCDHYSVIDSLMEVTAGTPEELRKRSVTGSGTLELEHQR